MFFDVIFPLFVIGILLVFLIWAYMKEYKRIRTFDERELIALESIADSLIHLGIDIDEIVDRIEDLEVINYTDEDDS